MKITFSLIVLLIQVNIIFGQNEREIYSKVINDYVLKNYQAPNAQSLKTILIVRDPLYMAKLDVKDFNRFKVKYNRLEESTFSNFLIGQNEKISEILKSQSNDIVFLNGIVANDSLTLSLKYPNWNHYLYEFSNIGFNTKKTQAILYYGFSGLGIGGGVYLIYEKKKKRWKEVKMIPAWAS